MRVRIRVRCGIFLLTCALSAHAAITCGPDVAVEGFGPSAAINTTGASLLVAGTAGFIFPAYPTDSRSNFWQYGSQYGGASGPQSLIPFVPAPAIASSHTFGIQNQAALFPSGVIFACSGTTTVYPLAAQNGLAHSSSSTFQSGSVTPLEIGDLLVSVSSCSQAGVVTSVTVDSGFSSPVINSSASFVASATAYLVVASTSAVNPTWTWTIANAANCSAAISVFRPASVPPPVLNPPNIARVAGKGGALGNAGSNGPALAAAFNWPGEIVFDSHGNYAFADIQNNEIKAVNLQSTTQTLWGVSIASGNVAIIAGTGTLGCADNATATSGQLGHPVGMAIDASGNLYIADQNCGAIRKLTTAGALSTPVGVLTLESNCASGSFSGDGGPATAAMMFCPQGVAIDSAGNIIASDSVNFRLRVTNTQGSTQNLYGQTGICAGCIQTFYGNGSQSTIFPLGLGFDPSGNLYAADYANFRVLKITASGVVSVFAGTGTQGYGPAGAATSAALNHVYDVKVDPNTLTVYIADTFNSTIWQVKSGTISVLAGNFSLFGTRGGSVGSGGPALLAALSGTGVGPVGIAPDGKGNLYEADTGNNLIQEIIAAAAPNPTLNTGAFNAGSLR